MLDSRTKAHSKDGVCPPLASTAEEGLRELFGLKHFRSGQREVVEATAAGNDALVVMPTGSGKSLCYQLPACLIDGVTVVVSPLIALMKDQVDALQERGLPVTFINSSISYGEQQDRLAALRMGLYKLLYVAPERFANESFRRALSEVKIGLFAIDEAHCISQWGHDFRPDYLRLAEVREALGNPPTIALTATATRFVQSDIVRQLGLPETAVHVRGFERPNLFFEVFHARGKDDKNRRMKALIDHHDGESVVIYGATRKQVEEVQRDLGRMGIEAGIYHAGLTEAERESVQDAWMQGNFPVLVATNAFGMGIDKADVRAIVHYNMPGSLEAYYQEAGRAGRDGAPANCLLLFNYADRGIHEFFIENSYPHRRTVIDVWNLLKRMGTGTHAIGASRMRSRLAGRPHAMGIEACLRLLRFGGHIDFGTRDGQDWVAVLDEVDASELRVDWERLDGRRQVGEQQLADVVQYASEMSCRQAQIVHYFGAEPAFGERCGNCDACTGPAEYALEAADELGRSITIRSDKETVVKKLLAGVARARGRFGAHNVAGMLRGSRAKKIREAGLDGLSTFGILGYLQQDDLVYLLDVLTRHRLLIRNEYGAIGLTELGGDVMRGEAPIPEAMDRVLEATFSERRGKAYTPPARSSASSGSSSGYDPEGDTYDETLALLKSGKNYVEVAEARGLTTNSILRHMLVLAERGEEIEVEGYLDGRLLPALRECAADWKVGDALKPLLEVMPVKCSYDELKLNLIQVLIERREA